MKRVILLFVLLLLAGCQLSGTRYSQSCNIHTDTQTSTCDITFEILTGAWSRGMDVARVATGESIPLRVKMHVAGGVVKVTFSAPDGTPVTAEAQPDQPVELQADALVSNQEIQITFESLDGIAQGVVIALEAG
ncbi:MAG: hypothetical protein K8L99_27245 [Anaerolineae bacterium]|nr:hypothetical protein [Anaerolineae bacterium]